MLIIVSQTGAMTQGMSWKFYGPTNAGLFFDQAAGWRTLVPKFLLAQQPFRATHAGKWVTIPINLPTPKQQQLKKLHQMGHPW